MIIWKWFSLQSYKLPCICVSQLFLFHLRPFIQPLIRPFVKLFLTNHLNIHTFVFLIVVESFLPWIKSLLLSGVYFWDFPSGLVSCLTVWVEVPSKSGCLSLIDGEITAWNRHSEKRNTDSVNTGTSVPFNKNHEALTKSSLPTQLTGQHR